MKGFNKKIIRIATFGDVDSGKSTLVGRLSELWNPRRGVGQNWHEVTDGLKLEREKGVTWCIGHSYCELQNVRIHFLDDPGHLARFDVTMGGLVEADIILYVIDPQKIQQDLLEFHLQILRWIEKKTVLFAINSRESGEEFHNPSWLNPTIKKWYPSSTIINANFITGQGTVSDQKTGTNDTSVADALVELMEENQSQKKIPVGDNSATALLWGKTKNKLLVFSDLYPNVSPIEVNEMIGTLVCSHEQIELTKIEYQPEFKEFSSLNLIVDAQTFEPIGLLKI